MPLPHILPAIAVAAAIGAATPAVTAASSVSATPAKPSQSRQLQISAAQTESAAALQYAAYADGALQGGRADLAGVWQSVGQVEHQDHWTHEVTLSGLYSGSDNDANLRTAITQAQQAAKAYTGWAAKAPRGSGAATALRTVGAREAADAGLLTHALAAQRGKGQVLAAPAVHAVPIQVSKAPHYAGSFYNDLTGDTNSALVMAAWNWAQYQFDAKTAVDTGQARLAALFSSLESQERYQNWAELSNTAGYVNSDASNLKASIASEQDAIDMYAHYADKAQKAGDANTARVFHNIRNDEIGHHQTFPAVLRQVDAGK